MTKTEWIAIARTLAAQRAAVAASWPPEPDLTNYIALHDRKLIYITQLGMCERFATVIAATLDRLSCNFDRHHFMRIVDGK